MEKCKNVRFKIKKCLCVYVCVCVCVCVFKCRFSHCIYVLGIALADVATCIEDAISYPDELTIPVFQLRDLTELYKK